MNIFKSLAIVLKSENWRETSKILTLFSQRFGKIRVIVKGARDPKSRLAGNLENAPVDKLDNYLWSYALKLASNLGYRPKLTACINCNKKESLSGEHLFFSAELGGMICKNCVQEGSFYLKLSKKSWEAMKLLLTSQNSHLESLALNKKQVSEISDTILSLL